MPLRGVTVALLPALLACKTPNPAFDPNGQGTATGGVGESDDSTEGGGQSDGVSQSDGELETDSLSGPGVDGTTGNELCGNGVIDSGEACDDEINDGSYGGCEPGCQASAGFCGDGIPQLQREACDDGVNVGGYDGCLPGCAGFDEFCGDGVLALEEGEVCDDSNSDLTDGCLPNCQVPHSCLEIREFADVLASGVYRVRPDDDMNESIRVYCDMETDGGGYTFLKVDRSGRPNPSIPAAQAEDVCEAVGMQLWIPRTAEHLLSGWSVATDETFGPGGGDRYVYIMGIYPRQPGSSCVNEAMVSGNPDCDWRAGDDQTFWVNGEGDINEPNGNDGFTQVDGSMEYLWDHNGVITWYDDQPGAGASSDRFMCDVGDKH